jgi:hypothetical protein
MSLGRYVGVGLLGVALAGCGGASTAKPREVVDPGVQAAMAEQPPAWWQARTKLHLASGMVVERCPDFVRFRCGGIAETAEDRAAEGEYVICDLMALRRSTWSVAARSVPAERGKALAERLDLRTFPSALRAKADDRAFVLASLAGYTLDVEAGKVFAKGPGMNHGFSVEEVTDIDGDGREDWLVNHFDQATLGPYRGYSLLVIRDVNRPGTLAAQPARDLLCAGR